MKKFYRFLITNKINNSLKFYYCDILLIGVLILSFFFRLSIFTPLWSNDGNRDYLVAYHIVQHKEYPAVGPASGSLYSILGTTNITSPLYFYLLAFFIFLKDSMITLGLVNIFFQLLNLIIIYVIASKLYSKYVGLIVVIIYGLSGVALEHSRDVFQPWIMEPFFNMSLLLLLFSYVKKRFLLLIASAVTVMVSGPLHYSAYLFLPEIILAAFFILYHNNYKPLYYVWYIGTLIISFLIIHVSPILLIFRNSSLLKTIRIRNEEVINAPYQQGLESFVQAGKDLITYYGFSHTIAPLILIIGIICIVWYTLSEKNSLKRVFIFLTIASLIQIMFIAYIGKFLHFELFRNITPILGICTILVIASLYSILRTSWFTKTLSIVVLIISLATLVKNSYLSLSFDYTLDFHKNYAENNLTKTIDYDVYKNRVIEKREKMNFFDIKSCNKGNIDMVDTRFWTYFEKKYNSKLVKLNDKTFSGYSIEDNKDYIYFVIYRIWDQEKSDPLLCVNKFFKKYPSYTQTLVYEDDSVIVYKGKKPQ